MKNQVVSGLAVHFLLLGCLGQAVAEDSPQDVIQKAIDAQGGKDKLSRLLICRGRSKGAAFIGGQARPFEGEFWRQLPGHVKTSVQYTEAGEQKSFVRVINGDRTWLRRGDATEEMTGAMRRAALESVASSYAMTLVPLLDAEQFTLESLGPTKVGEHAAVGVKVRSKGHSDVRLFFDKESGLLLKSEEEQIGDDNEKSAVEMFFYDYKDVGGVKLYTRRVDFLDGAKSAELECGEVEFLDKIDPDTFSKP